METAIKTRSQSIPFILAASLVALGCTAIESRAQAADAEQALTKTVTYGDLNLDSRQGAEVLYARLRRAAEDVCLPLDGRDLTQRSHWQRCFDNAVASAVAQVNKTTVTALHNQTVGHSTKG
jgi:UrcA family protein